MSDDRTMLAQVRAALDKVRTQAVDYKVHMTNGGDMRQVRFPRSKRRRIRRKWAKNPKNSQFFPDNSLYVCGSTGQIYGSETALARLKRHMQAQEG